MRKHGRMLSFCLFNVYSDGTNGSGKGTCTCTCETKPASSSSSSSSSTAAESGIVHPVKPVQQYVPQTASLMRTAARPKQSSTAPKPKPVKQPQSHNEPAQPRRQGSGIISVPPMDYSLDNAYEPAVNQQSSIEEPASQSQHQQQQQQVDTANEQEYVNYIHTYENL